MYEFFLTMTYNEEGQGPRSHRVYIVRNKIHKITIIVTGLGKEISSVTRYRALGRTCFVWSRPGVKE